MTTQQSPAKSGNGLIVSKLLSGLFVIGVIAGGWFAVQYLGREEPSTQELANVDVEANESEIVLPEAIMMKATF